MEPGGAVEDPNLRETLPHPFQDAHGLLPVGFPEVREDAGQGLAATAAPMNPGPQVFILADPKHGHLRDQHHRLYPGRNLFDERRQILLQILSGPGVPAVDDEERVGPPFPEPAASGFVEICPVLASRKERAAGVGEQGRDAVAGPEERHRDPEGLAAVVDDPGIHQRMGTAEDDHPGPRGVSVRPDAARAPRFRRPFGRGHGDAAAPVAGRFAPSGILGRRTVVQAAREGHGVEATQRIHLGRAAPRPQAQGRRQGQSARKPGQAPWARPARVAEGGLHPAIGGGRRSQTQDAARHGSGRFGEFPVIGQEAEQHDQRPMPQIERVGPQAQPDQRGVGQCPRQGMGRMAHRDQDGGGTEGRDQRDHPEGRIGMRHRDEAGQEQDQADPTRDGRQASGRRRRPGPVGGDRPEQQFPSAGGQEVEGPRGVVS